MSRPGWLALVAAVLAVVASVLTWRADTTTGEAAPATGAALFHAKGCSTCHTGPDSTSSFGGFPSLSSASTWAGSRREGMSATEYLAESMRTPAAFISPAFTGGAGPTDRMPQLALSEAEIDALVDYLLQG